MMLLTARQVALPLHHLQQLLRLSLCLVKLKGLLKCVFRRDECVLKVQK
jgi:hypothetical protein